MKKSLLLLGLLYLFSCEEIKFCSDYSYEKEPTESDCFKRELTEEEIKLNDSCCYIKGKVILEGQSQAFASCVPLAPN